MQVTSVEIGRELSHGIDGEVRVDPVTRALYSTAACIYRIVPKGVVFPRSGEDVAATLRYCADRDIPVTARGAGSGVAGQTLGRGLIIDFTRYMDRILEINREEKWVRVEPGVIFGDLNRVLESVGLVFPPDPSSGEFCAIGGMLANNSGGAHSVRYGTTDDHVLSASLFLPGGVELEARRYDLSMPNLDQRVREIARIVGENRSLIEEKKPKTTKNASGYNIWDVLDHRSLDLAKLLVGSEGTLGIFTEAKLNLLPLPGSRATAMFCFSSLESMAESVGEIKESGASTIELMDRSLIDLLSGSDSSYHLGGLPENMEAILLIEFSGSDLEEVEQKASGCLKRIKGSHFSFDYRLAIEPDEQDELWAIRDRASSIFRQFHYPAKPLRFIEDGTVAVSDLPIYIRRLRDVLESFGMRATIFGHAGDGNVHVNPLVDLTRPDFRDTMRKVAGEVVSIVRDLGGTLTGEHGDGRLRTPYLAGIYGDELYEVFRDIKRVFDPDGLLNPGIIVGGDIDPDITSNLRYGYTLVRDIAPFDEFDARVEIDKCHGCGSCRVYCPPFTGSGEEKSTARSKANLFREFLIGETISETDTTTAPFKDVFNLCTNCKLCTSECPSRVDIPWLSIIARSKIHDREGFSIQDRTLMSAASLSASAARVAPLSNRMARNPFSRRMMERIIGIHRERVLPGFDAKGDEFIPRSDDLEKGKVEIVYFPGCYAAYHSREGEGKDTVALLTAMNYHVRIVEDACCGVARLTIGDVEGFKTRAAELVDRFTDTIRNGVEVVFSSPSCLMCVREEYPRFLGSEAAEDLAARSLDILELIDREGDSIWERMPANREREDVVLHIPCHLKSNGTHRTFLRVMEKIPGVRVIDVNERCCGLAGTFGMRKERFDLSMRIASNMFRDFADRDGVEVITPCGSCRMQIEQGMRSNVLHPVQLIARYSLNKT